MIKKLKIIELIDIILGKDKLNEDKKLVYNKILNEVFETITEPTDWQEYSSNGDVYYEFKTSNNNEYIIYFEMIRVKEFIEDGEFKLINLCSKFENEPYFINISFDTKEQMLKYINGNSSIENTLTAENETISLLSNLQFFIKKYLSTNKELIAISAPIVKGDKRMRIYNGIIQKNFEKLSKYIETINGYRFFFK
jgi:hypothetical protein